jgi:1-acyl-sn-glycerol-3-phosphate acyltransferase
LIVVSNHRSLLDVPLVMALLNRPVRFAAHAYMGKVPALRELISAMGAFPLSSNGNRHNDFFRESIRLLLDDQAVGIFPEGPLPMIQAGRSPTTLSHFQRGFAHLAYRAPVQQVVVLPVAIASLAEREYGVAPFRLFHLMDPSEPLFDQKGWHHATFYRRVSLLVGQPVVIDEPARERYRGRQGAQLTRDLSLHCHDQIASLLHLACS